MDRPNMKWMNGISFFCVVAMSLISVEMIVGFLAEWTDPLSIEWRLFGPLWDVLALLIFDAFTRAFNESLLCCVIKPQTFKYIENILWNSLTWKTFICQINQIEISHSFPHHNPIHLCLPAEDRTDICNFNFKFAKF